jgi:hypothetical protein
MTLSESITEMSVYGSALSQWPSQERFELLPCPGTTAGQRAAALASDLDRLAAGYKRVARSIATQ